MPKAATAETESIDINDDPSYTTDDSPKRNSSIENIEFDNEK